MVITAVPAPTKMEKSVELFPGGPLNRWSVNEAMYSDHLYCVLPDPLEKCSHNEELCLHLDFLKLL